MLAFSPDGTSLTAAGEDRTVQITSLRTGETRTLGPFPVMVTSVVFSPDGRFLAGGSNRDLYLWRTSDWQPLGVIQAQNDRVNAVAFSPDGKMLVTGGRGSLVKIWRVE